MIADIKIQYNLSRYACYLEWQMFTKSDTLQKDIIIYKAKKIND